MSKLSALLSVLVAVALVFAPFADAWAPRAMAATDASAVEQSVGQSHASMGAEGAGQAAGHHMEASHHVDDCAAMMKASAAVNDCPFCSSNEACADTFCLSKCLQLFGLAEPSKAVFNVASALLLPSNPHTPADWSEQPQPLPPRS